LDEELDPSVITVLLFIRLDFTNVILVEVTVGIGVWEADAQGFSAAFGWFR